ncbi:MAG: hypothetical protein CVV47_06040 [Spirochaetae bacterium HGW-Spirochaetae-3]|nr:MAG: hypothetical protein CVV47_06040 [Spirochaetae bacterium HGW-Spirochaetae-3]
MLWMTGPTSEAPWRLKPVKNMSRAYWWDDLRADAAGIHRSERLSGVAGPRLSRAATPERRHISSIAASSAPEADLVPASAPDRAA